MEFNNRENECVTLTDGRVVWLSRSVAVVGIVCIIKEHTPYFLISKRGPKTPDFQGYYNITCGYLDFDENTFDAVRREVWEETGVNIDLLDNSWPTDVPYLVVSDPKQNKQNVTIIHVVLSEIKDDEEFPKPNITNYGEVSDALWVRFDELDKYDFAFNHKERLFKFLEHIGY